MKTLRWGILGAAKFAREQMAPAIHAANGAALHALATSRHEKAEPFAAFAPGLRVHDSYEALLDDPDIDAVYIPLPNTLHVEWTLKALAKGKHVLCEKPLAMKADTFDEVISARDESGLLAAEAYMIVHHPQWQRARDLVADGAIGELVHADVLFTYHNGDQPQNIRNQASLGGGGLADIGVYAIGSVRFVTGKEPEAITLANVKYESGVDTFAQVAAAFPGFSYSALVSMRMAPAQHVTFHGTDGLLRLTAPFNPLSFGQAEVHLHRNGAHSVIERFPGVNHYKLQVEAFGRSVLDGVPYPCPLEFVRGTQQMIDRIHEKAGGA